MQTASQRVSKRLRAQACKKYATKVQKLFFKTGAGSYSEGDKFLGLRMPQIRQTLKEECCLAMKIQDAKSLLQSDWHEVHVPLQHALPLKSGGGTRRWVNGERVREELAAGCFVVGRNVG